MSAADLKAAERKLRLIIRRPGVSWHDRAAARVFGQLRDALLRGEAVTLPGIGRIEVTRSEGYTIQNPISGKTQHVAVATKVRYQPARTLLRDLEASDRLGG